MYTLVLAEAALERIPRELWTHPAVQRHALRRRGQAGEMLLDVSYHYAAMRKLSEWEKRGRPDIIHFCLLEALGSPLARRGLLDVYVHSREGVSIHVAAKTRLPRNYERFLGLIEQVLQTGKAPQTREPLLTARKETLRSLVRRIHAESVFLLREESPRISLKKLGRALFDVKDALVILGAFPHGDFAGETSSLADVKCSIYPESLEAWTVLSRALCALEEVHGFFEYAQGSPRLE